MCPLQTVHVSVMHSLILTVEVVDDLHPMTTNNRQQAETVLYFAVF